MKTFIRTLEIPIMGFSSGYGNGYVIIPKGHAMHGKHYDDIPVDVHGGLTFGQPVSDLSDWDEIENESSDSWVVGFDTCHYGDNKENWCKENVKKELDNLEKQLQKIA